MFYSNPSYSKNSYDSEKELKKKSKFMKWIFTLSIALVCVFFSSDIRAQSSCQYTLELFDSFGDGWNGASLTITINGVSSVYTLDNINDDGMNATFDIDIMEGDSVSFFYVEGGFPFEVSYQFLNPAGGTVFSDGFTEPPMQGDVFSGVLSCSCFPLDPQDVTIDNIRAFNVNVNWQQADENDEYLLEFDTIGFTPGNGNYATGTGDGTTLTGLEENTEYDLYLTVLCASGDTSSTIGPFTFR